MDELLQLIFPKSGDPNIQLPDPDLMQFYEDIDNRVYWIQGEITDGLLDLVSKIIKWNADDMFADKETRTPIKLFINSPGGSLEMAKTLIDIILISKTPIYGYALGMTASAASMIFLACHKKYAIPSATFVFHKGSCDNIGGDFQQVQSFMKDYEQQINELVDFYKKNTTYPEEVIESKLNQGDWYVRVKEGLENGVVDQIIDDITYLII